MSYIKINNRVLIRLIREELEESCDSKFLMSLIEIVTKTLSTSSSWEKDLDYKVMLKLLKQVKKRTDV